jgi:Rieske 2Fe-2S family protein
MDAKATARPETGARRRPHVVDGVQRLDMRYSTALPREYYVSKDIYEKEVDKIFSRQWTFVGHVSELPKIGDYFIQEFAGESVVVVREAADKINGYLNVCRHRGHSLCAAPRGNIRKFVCPYHYWSYGLDGALKNAPGAPDGAVFNYQDWPLHRVGIEDFQGFLFAYFGTDEAPRLGEKFAAARGELERLNTPALKEIHRESYELNCNWKTLLENYLECYHCQGSHQTLCKTMDLEAMYAGTDEWQDPYFTGPVPLRPGLKTVSLNGEIVSRPLGAFASVVDLPTGYGSGFGVVPTLTRGIVHIDHAVVHALRPIDVGRVRWETRWYVRDDAVEGVDYDRENVIAVWTATNKEDIALCENAYRGVRSRRFRPGPLDNKRESAIPPALTTYLEMMAAE